MLRLMALTQPSNWQKGTESPRPLLVPNTRWTRQECSTSGSSSSARCRSGTTVNRWCYSERLSIGGRLWPIEQAQQRAVAQVRAAVAKWNGATELVNESAGLSKELDKEVAVLDRLFEAGQADLTKLMQARQRLIQLQNAQLDAVWQATQAQADLLLALGMPSLIHAMLSRAEDDAGVTNATAPAQAPPPAVTITPSSTSAHAASVAQP